MRRATLMNSGAKGVLDPKLRDRIDLVHYFSALRLGSNCGIRPQGGIYRRPGTVLASGMDFLAAGTKRRNRRRLEPIQVTTGMVTVGNGGTAANLVSENDGSGDLFVTNSVGGSPFVVCEVDLGSAKPLTFVDVSGFKCASNGVDDGLAVEYSDGVTWFAFDGRRNVRTTARTRRFGSAPGGPGGSGVVTRYVRLVLYGASGTGAFTISRLRLWTEKRRVSPGRVIMFARAADTKYELVLTDRNVDVYKNHRWVSAIPVPVDATQVMSTTWAQSLDTLHLYHEDVETRVVTRMGADDEWNDAPIVLTNVPTLSPATAFSGNTNEVQQLQLSSLITSQVFRLWIDDEVTAPITFSGTGTLAASIASALGALPALAGTNPTVTLVDATSRTVEIVFSGSIGSRRWAPVLAVIIGDDVLTPRTTVIQRGIDAAGALASKRTGFPRCGLFNQSRHSMGGFRSAPQTVINSRSGAPYDLQTTGTLTPDLAFMDTLDTDQNETIYRLFVGKHLQAFTESGAWFQEARTQDATQPRNWRLATRPGIEPGVPVVFCDDASFFMQSGARVVQELNLVSNVDAAYAPTPKNLLAPHLVTGAVDFAVREPRTTEEAPFGYIVNRDGTIAHMISQKAQETVAFLPWVTDGAFRSAGVDVAGNVWALVDRETPDGFGDLYLERFDDTTPFDATVKYEFAVPTQTITGLGHLEGKENVWAYVDRDLYGPFAVDGGQITLPLPALDVFVGAFSPWEMEPMPIRAKLSETQPFKPPGRIYEVEISAHRTGPLDLAVNGGPPRAVPITYLGAKQRDGGPFQEGGEFDLPLLDRLFSGSIIMQNLRGWSKHPRWTLSQSKPAPVEILAVRSELSFKG